MKKLFLVLVLAFLFSNSSSIARDNRKMQKTGNLTIFISGLKNNKGDIKIGLFNSKDSYDGKEKKFKGAILKINNKTAKWEIKDIPFGEYAVKAFHDEDKDDKIDTNFLGIPTEGYGFSNNAKGFFGPPSFEKAKFPFKRDSLAIEIKFR